MGKRHNKRTKFPNRANANPKVEGQTRDNSLLAVETPKPPYPNGDSHESTEEQKVEAKESNPLVVEASKPPCPNGDSHEHAEGQKVKAKESHEAETTLLLQRIDSLKASLKKLRLEEEYTFYESSKDFLSEILGKYHDIQTLIQKANISFEKLNYDLSAIIIDAKIFEKNFDVLCLFKSPAINKEAKDWFDSLSRALDMITKAMKGEKDEKLGRVPPTNFRACIKNSSQFDPIYTISVSTPIYRVKADSCTDEFFPIAWKGANSFSLHCKYLLNTEQKLKSALLTVLSESDTDKEIRNLCSPPTIDEAKDLITYICDCESTLADIESDIKEYDDFGRVDELESIESIISDIPRKLTEINNRLYNAKDQAEDRLSSVKKKFYKAGLSDLFKLYNDILKLISSFEKTDVATSRSEESQTWHGMLLKMKVTVTDYLNRLGIYENETVYENETIWNENMDFIEIMDGEEDDSKPEGQISKINSIGFHYMLPDKQKVFIEKTKVFVYRRS